MNATLAARRIFGIEKKNRVKTTISIEKEFLELLSGHKMNASDCMNISIQDYLSAHGVPVLLVALEPDGVRAIGLSQSDIMNLALGDLFRKKGIIN